MQGPEYIAICFKFDRDPLPRRYHIAERQIPRFNAFLARQGYLYYNLYDRFNQGFVQRIWIR